MYTWDSYVHNIMPLTITPRTLLDYTPSVFLFFNFTTGSTKILKAEMRNFLLFTTINSLQ